jgi:hypothetical protein
MGPGRDINISTETGGVLVVTAAAAQQMIVYKSREGVSIVDISHLFRVLGQLISIVGP